MPVFLDSNSELFAKTASFSWSAIYVAILIVMAIALSINVVVRRAPNKVGLGDGGNASLMRAIRVHGNFMENVPLTMVTLVLLGIMGAPLWSVHLVGLTMVIGRAFHAYGISKTGGISFGRGAGMALTFMSLILSAIFLIWFSWR